MNIEQIHIEIVEINKWWQRLAALKQMPTRDNILIGGQKLTTDELYKYINRLRSVVEAEAKDDIQNWKRYKGWLNNLTTASKYLAVAQGDKPKTKMLKIIAMKESSLST